MTLSNTIGITGRLHDHMASYFGDSSVFQDVDDILPGLDFRVALANAVASCDVVLAVIGPDWAGIMQERAKKHNDFVRIEVESAFEQDKLVVPVLVKGAEMPSPDDVPESLQDLCWRNAVQVRHDPDFRRDCQRLATRIPKSLEKHIASATKTTAPSEIRLSGLQIYEGFKNGNLPTGKNGPMRIMGRNYGGLKGKPLKNDFATGGWKTWEYQVSSASKPPNHNWFYIEEFVREIDRRKRE